MAHKYGKISHRQHNIMYTVITAILLCVVFLSMVTYIYQNAEDEGYEYLHMQTKQIKDDIQLQLKSDLENLSTMASFASKLYSDGESYDLMFNSFEPIGLIGNIGILNPDNTFVTKAGQIDLNDAISFNDEAAKGEYISGRLQDLTNDKIEIIRCAVPIKSSERTVGILYGVIKPETLNGKYDTMAKELDAQLYVYEKGTGNLVIDTRHDELGNVSLLKEREYKKGFSYEQMVENDKGYSAFKSVATGEMLYVHYSTLDIGDWHIMLARPGSNVFANAHKISSVLFAVFAIMVLIIVIYLLLLLGNEKSRNSVTENASRIRKLLLEINQHHSNILDAMENITSFAKSRSAFFVDTDGEDYNFVSPIFAEKLLSGDDRKYFISEILRYAAELHKVRGESVSVMRITANMHLYRTNIEFFDFLKKHSIHEISFATVVDKNNHISALGAINPRKSREARALVEDVAVCFSIAIFNKKHLNRTEVAATTDSLTGVSNRVTYKKDLIIFDEERPENFSCIYIDVNELHLHNNKHGHAAGDEMLLYIANTLKEVFYGHRIYRMGGDEFLVFAEGVTQDAINESIHELIERLLPMNYHVAIGAAYRTQNTNTEEMVREAEIRMYEAKAQYYQNKEQKSVSSAEDKGYDLVFTGIKEIDTMLSVMKEHYNGIYRVSLNTDEAHRILMPSYLGYKEDEQNFSRIFTKYIDETVNPDFHRAIMSFLNYDALKRQLSDCNVPRITYKKTNGETVVLSVYSLKGTSGLIDETLWVFAKA